MKKTATALLPLAVLPLMQITLEKVGISQLTAFAIALVIALAAGMIVGIYLTSRT